MGERSQPWDRTLIPIDIPASEHFWRKHLNMLNGNEFTGIKSDDESKPVTSSRNLTSRDERIFTKSILPNGVENITVVVMSKPKIENDETPLERDKLPFKNGFNHETYPSVSRLSAPGKLDFESFDTHHSRHISNCNRDHAGPSFRSIKSEHYEMIQNRDNRQCPVTDYRGNEHDSWNHSSKKPISFQGVDNLFNGYYNNHERYDRHNYYYDCQSENFNRSVGPHRPRRHKGRHSDPGYYKHSNRTPAQSRIERLSKDLRKNIPVLKRTVRFDGSDAKTDAPNSNKPTLFEPERGKYGLTGNSISNNATVEIPEIKKENLSEVDENSIKNLDCYVPPKTFVPEPVLSPVLPLREAKKRSFSPKDDEFCPTESKKSRLTDLDSSVFFYQSCGSLFNRSNDNLNHNLKNVITPVKSPLLSPPNGSPSRRKNPKQPATSRLLSVKNFARCKNVQKASEPGARDLLASVVSSLKKSTEREDEAEEEGHSFSKETPLSNILSKQCENSPVTTSTCTSTVTTSNSVESMEWEEIPYEVIDSEIKEIRKNSSSLSTLRNSDLNSSNFDPNSIPYLGQVFIVLDTNVILSSLDLVKKLTQTSVCGTDIIVVIPWQVLSELDYLKSKSKSISTRARAASSYLSEQLSKKHPNLKSQPPNRHDSSVLDFKPEVPDDYIILACLQLKQNDHPVGLITNDKNLMAKSEAAEIPTFSEISIMKILNQKNYTAVSVALENPPSNDEKTEDCNMAHHLAKAFISFLKECVEKRVKERYGPLWPFYMLKIPPWNFLECIRNARANWDIINNNTDLHYEQLSKLNSIEMFFKNTKYSSIDAMKLHTLFDNCCSLAESIPYTALAGNFITQANKLIKENLKLAENRSVTPILDVHNQLEDIVPVNEGRAKYVIERFNFFSDKVVTICGCLYRMMNLKWPVEGEIPGKNLELSSEQAEEFHRITKIALENIISGLKKIMQTERGKVNSESPGVVIVYKYLTEFINCKNTTLEDLVHFANFEEVRKSMDRALGELENLVHMFNRVG